MRTTFNLVAAAVTAAAFVATVSLPAMAACKRYGFTVNDYGKDGPTKDAKALLDKLIATKMSEQGIKDFRTGKKTVSCDLFLNFIVFDEHTCTAEATVCWGGSVLPKSEDMAATDDAVAKPKKASAVAAEPSDQRKHASKTSSTEKKKSASLKVIADPKKPVVAEPPEHAASAPEAAASEAAPAAASNEVPAEAPAPETAAAQTASPVETGSLSEAPKTHHQAEKAASESNDVPPVQLDTGAGYPTPEAPQENQ